MPQDSWYVRPTRDKSLPAHDRGLTYAAYHTEKPFVFEVFDGQGNITGVGPWYRRDRHEHYAKGSRVKNPGENNQVLYLTSNVVSHLNAQKALPRNVRLAYPAHAVLPVPRKRIASFDSYTRIYISSFLIYTVCDGLALACQADHCSQLLMNLLLVVKLCHGSDSLWPLHASVSISQASHLNALRRLWTTRRVLYISLV